MNKYKNKGNISGKLINKIRTDKKLSLEKLSNKLQLMGITLYPNDLFLIEKEKRILKDFELIMIFKVLEVDINIFLEELFKHYL